MDMRFLYVLTINCASNIGWGRAVEMLERSVEIGQVAKTDFERDPRNTSLGPPSVRQHAVCAHEPTDEHELRERHSLTFEQLADVTVRDPLAPRHRSRRKIAVGEVRFDVGLNGV